MESAIIVAIISSSLTAIITIVNIFISIKQRNSNDRLATITSGRIKYLDKIRDANAQFVSRTERVVINYCVVNPSNIQNFPLDLSLAVYNLKTRILI